MGDLWGDYPKDIPTDHTARRIILALVVWVIVMLPLLYVLWPEYK